MGLLRKVTGKTVSRNDAKAQRKTFLHFEKRLWNVGTGSIEKRGTSGTSIKKKISQMNYLAANHEVSES